MSGEQTSTKSDRGRRAPRRISEEYLERAGLYYLGRFESSAENFRRILMRKVDRAAHAHGDDPAIGAAMIDALLARFKVSGYLDDSRYAETRVRSLHSRGVSLRAIRGKLAQKGVGADDIDAAIAALESEESTTSSDEFDLKAACIFARRRRIGPWRKAADGKQNEKRRDRELAALARAGFSYDLAHRVVASESAEDLEAEAG